MRKTIIFILFAALIGMSPHLWAKSADERIGDLENRVNSIQQTYLSNNADIARAISRSETVQAEFDSIKGAVETNSHLLDAQRQELQKLIRELEHRIQSIEDRMQIFSTQINAAIGKVNPAAAEEGKLYQSGLDKADQGQYLNAAADFQTFLKKYPKSTFAPMAQYWIGECFYSMRDYKRTIKEFQIYIQANPRHEKVASAILKQGNSFYELGMVEESKPFYEKVIKEYPGSAEAALATAKLQRPGQKQAAGTQQPQAGGAPQQTPQTPATTGSAAGSYPNETIEQQRAKYQQSAPKPAGQTAPQTTQPQKQDTKQGGRYIEF